MTDQKCFRLRLLIAASIVAGVAAASPALARPPGYSAPARFRAIDVSYGLVRRPLARTRAYTPLRRVHYRPGAHDRFDPVAAPQVTVLPEAREDHRAAVELLPEAAHYDHAPSGLDDDPTTFGLVAKF
jgi:hypothetical protein